MQYAITLGLHLLPFAIVIIVSIILRKVMIRVLGENHPINSYVLVIIPVMAVLLGAYVLARPIFVGQRAVEVVANTQMAIASGSYTIDESWRDTGIKAFEVGEVVVYKTGSKKAYENQSSMPGLEVGRVIGTPGQRLEAVHEEHGGAGKDWSLYIDGKRIENAKLPGTDVIGINDLRFGLTVPEGSLWVVIDKGRRMGVFESDSPYVGPIRTGQIVGKIRAWSEKDFGALVEEKK